MPRTKSRPVGMSSPASDRFVPLSDDDVKELTDCGSFSRGRTYFRRGAIEAPVLVGDTIRASCWGSDINPYHVTATLAPTGAGDNSPTAWSCSCPRGGFCKHIVALLLTWIDNPGRFEERPPVSALLAERSREELIVLIERLLAHDPDLERLIELPVTTANATAAPNVPTVNAAVIRRQVESVIRATPTYEWGSNAKLARELQTVVGLGDAYARAGAWSDAGIVYSTAATAIVDHYAELWDQEGEIAVVIGNCATGLSNCLDAQDGLPEGDRLAKADRSLIIGAIFNIWKYDILQAGGIDLSLEGPAVVARCASADERAELVGWLHTIRDSLDDSTNQWNQVWIRQCVVEFEAMLGEAAGMDDEAMLALYRDAELWPETAGMLLGLERVSEAIGIADRKVTDQHAFLDFANQLFAMGGEHETQAIDLVDGRLWETEGKNKVDDGAYLKWLADRYAEEERPAKALEMARRHFKQAPSLATYSDVHAAATLPGQPPDTWPPIRDELLQRLRAVKAWPAMIEIALQEHDSASALAALAALEQSTGRPAYTSSYGFLGAPGYAIRVAEAVEGDRAEEAIRLYRGEAQRLIGGRNRTYYHQAAEYLARVKRILTANQRASEWKAIIGEIRTENKRLRALLQELDTLKLT